MRNISVKYFEFWTSGSGDVVWIHFLSRALVVILFGGTESFEQFWQRA